MSNIQTKTKNIIIPFLNGNWHDLNRADQVQLATWITMTTMVIEYADIYTLATTQCERETFNSMRAPLSSWTIWIGRCDCRLWKEGFNHFGLNGIRLYSDQLDDRLRNHTPQNPLYLAQSTAFVLGTLFAISVSGLEISNAEQIKFAKDHGLKCLWPIQNDTITTPERVLNDHQADTISKAFVPASMRSSVRPAWVTPLPHRKSRQP
jgi:hypothetical protein